MGKVMDGERKSKRKGVKDKERERGGERKGERDAERKSMSKHSLFIPCCCLSVHTLVKCCLMGEY